MIIKENHETIYEAMLNYQCKLGNAPIIGFSWYSLYSHKGLVVWCGGCVVVCHGVSRACIITHI